jgi:hypothetical protein
MGEMNRRNGKIVENGVLFALSRWIAYNTSRLLRPPPAISRQSSVPLTDPLDSPIGKPVLPRGQF